MSVGSHFTVHTASSFSTFSHIDDSEVKLLDGTLSTPDKIPFGRISLPLNLTHMTPLLVGPPFGQSYFGDVVPVLVIEEVVVGGAVVGGRGLGTICTSLRKEND